MFGSQVVPMSAPPVATTWTSLMFGPPSRSWHVEARVLVVALVEGRVVAGELGLGDPLQLELDRRSARPTPAPPPLDAPALLPLELHAATSSDQRATQCASTLPRQSHVDRSSSTCLGGRRLADRPMSLRGARW